MTTTRPRNRPSHIVDPMDESHCLCGAVIRDLTCAGGPILPAATTKQVRKLAALGGTFAEVAGATGTSPRIVALLVHAR